jgi:hypothetical protein
LKRKGKVNFTTLAVENFVEGVTMLAEAKVRIGSGNPGGLGS